jgi:glycosyltransferase involved in cell wall biosynthesis
MQPKISILHPYILGRHDEINAGLYPKHHLWGTKAISKHWTCESFIRPCTIFGNSVEKFINRFAFGHNSPGLSYEIQTLKTSHSNDLIYSVSGPLSLTQFYKRSKIVSWVFRPPYQEVKSPLNPYHKFNLKSNAGFLCLTPKAQRYFSQYAPSKFIPWCVDLDMFDGKRSIEKLIKPFFLASGKTGRDYGTLVKAAYKISAEVRIIGPSDTRPSSLPSNVKWIETSKHPPDKAIDYPTLKEWYAQCIGVCIPLSGDAEDTCGYTNMLEGMAMKKPILMTRSGCLHIDPKSRDFGLLIDPQDVQGWVDAMNRIIDDPVFADSCGKAGRNIVEKEFTIERFNRDVISFINDIIKCDD